MQNIDRPEDDALGEDMFANLGLDPVPDGDDFFNQNDQDAVPALDAQLANDNVQQQDVSSLFLTIKNMMANLEMLGNQASHE